MADEDKGDDVELDRILFDDISDDLDDAEFLKRQMAHLENMEKMLDDIDEYCGIEGMCEDDDAEEEMDMDDEDLLFMGDVDELEDMELQQLVNASPSANTRMGLAVRCLA